MPKPKGFRIDAEAYEKIAADRGMNRTQVAQACDPPMNLPTLSGLLAGHHGASARTVRQLASGLGCAPEEICPEFALRREPRVVVARRATDLGDGDDQVAAVGERLPRAMTPPEAAEILGISAWKVNDLVRSGHIARIPHTGRRVLIAGQELERFIAAGVSA